MHGKNVICYLVHLHSKTQPTEKELIHLMSVFGPIKTTKTLNNQNMLILLIEFAYSTSANLAIETLNQTLSYLGTITVSFPSTANSPYITPKEITPNFVKNATCAHKPTNDQTLLPNTLNFQQTNQPKIQLPIPSHPSKPPKENTAPSIFLSNPTSFTNASLMSIPAFEFLETLRDVGPVNRRISQTTPECFSYLLIQHLNINHLKLNHILNLLGSFTNVTNFMIDRQSDTGVFAFLTDSRIDFIVSVLHDQVFFGKTLIAKKVTHFVDLASLLDFNSERLIVGAENRKNYRYQQGLVIKFNPPSKMVHLTNISPSLSQKNLFDILGKYHHPVRMVKLKQRSSSASEMYLIEFDQLFKSLEILSIFHNTNVAEKSIKVSFSHTRLDKVVN